MEPDADSLLQRLPWGVVVLDAHGTVRRLNEQAARWWGALPPDVQGKPVGPATDAGSLPTELRQALQQVMNSPAQFPAAFFLPQHQQWIAMSSARQGDDWVVYWQDVTPQKQRQRKHETRQAASDSLLRRTEAVARTGSYELALATGQFEFSDGLFRLFGEEPGAFVPDFALIDARSHPDDVAGVQRVLAQAVADCLPYYYQRRIYRPDGQLRTLEVHGRVECDALGQPIKLLGLLQDVTGREQAAQELLRVKDELAQRATDSYRVLCDSMDEGFCIVEVLFDEVQCAVDYRFREVNPAFERHTGLREVLGKTMRELVPAIEPFSAQVYGRVVCTGESTRFEGYAEAVGRWFDVNAFRIGPPQHRHVAVLFTDISARKRTEEALRESDASLRQAVELAHLGICHWDYEQDVMRGNDERFRMLGLDPAQDVLPVAQAVALTHPDDREPTWASIRAQLAAQGNFQATYRIVRAGDGAVRWLSEVGRVVERHREKPARVSSVLLDVTQDHEAAEALRQSEAQLLAFTAELERQVAGRTRALSESQARVQSVVDSVSTAVVLLQAVRDAEGSILDFEYVLVNPVAQAHHPGQSVIGQRCSKLHPGIRLTPVFGQLAAVVETGRRADFEVYYGDEGYNHWFRVVGVKVGDGLLYTAEDITARKLLEQAQAKSLALLQGSEAVAGLGSWDYHLETRELTWSEGLYRLLDRPVGSPVRLQLFLDAVLDDDRPAAAQLVQALTGEPRSADTTLRLRVGDAVKTVRFRAVPLPAAPGAPERMLGVCLDVSDVQRLEAENLALKLDHHKELLLAILQAQETERRRLGEVLHNGLGQVLYATKLRLDQLDTPALHALPALAGVHQETVRLLADAMRQNRTLAHELVPTSLADFGLAAAVCDVCRDLTTPQLRIACHVWGEELTLPQPVQVTLFRLAQELALNIVRHAGATEAALELETMPGGVSLRAEDNGHGFDPLTVAEGLGLRTVRQAVALLGGTVAVDSSPKYGTHIRLRIPFPLFS